MWSSRGQRKTRPPAEQQAHGSVHGTGIAVGAHGKPDVRPGILRKREVAFERDGFSEAVMKNVADHADHFGLLVAHQMEVLSERVLTRPQSFCEFLIDDYDRSGIGVVACGKFAAAKLRDAHGPKISRIDGVHADERLLATRKWGAPFGIA